MPDESRTCSGDDREKTRVFTWARGSPHQRSYATAYSLDQYRSNEAANDFVIHTPTPRAANTRRSAFVEVGNSKGKANGATEIDNAIVAVLDRSNEGETVELEFRRKENDIGQLFAFDVLHARELHRRLAQPSAQDALATKFARLVPERRHRLLMFLADARRREAQRGARR